MNMNVMMSLSLLLLLVNGTGSADWSLITLVWLVHAAATHGKVRSAFSISSCRLA